MDQIIDGPVADGALESLILAARCPVALAPAMDTEMWEHPAVRANVERLRGFGYALWGPVTGPLASGRRGPGRMIEPAEIARLALKKGTGARALRSICEHLLLETMFDLPSRPEVGRYRITPPVVRGERPAQTVPRSKEKDPPEPQRESA